LRKRKPEKLLPPPFQKEEGTISNSSNKAKQAYIPLSKHRLTQGIKVYRSSIVTQNYLKKEARKTPYQKLIKQVINAYHPVA